VFSQLGENTLLVDANLRQPSQHEIFALKGRQGLSDVLAGRAELDAVAKVDSFVSLSVLAAGTLPPNPQELLARPGSAALNAKLESRYDVTLYDVAASASGLDALILAARTGGALIVARKNHSRLADINTLASQIAGNGGTVLGSVLLDFR
jgi:protein-tyrosine kinase